MPTLELIERWQSEKSMKSYLISQGLRDVSLNLNPLDWLPEPTLSICALETQQN